jgi:hypothetical protein
MLPFIPPEKQPPLTQDALRANGADSMQSMDISAHQAIEISTSINCFNVLATMQPRSATRTIFSI